MLETWRETAGWLLGLGVDPAHLTFFQMGCRVLVVFCFAVFLARVADRRILGHHAGFDIMLLVVLGSVLSRGINGQAAFFPTLGACGLLVLFHHVVATIAFRSKEFSQWVKGGPRTLVRDGQPDRDALRQNKITDDDLEENLRLNGGLDALAQVAEARLERNGAISVVKTKERPDRAQ